MFVAAYVHVTSGRKRTGNRVVEFCGIVDDNCRMPALMSASDQHSTILQFCDCVRLARHGHITRRGKRARCWVVELSTG